MHLYHTGPLYVFNMADPAKQPTVYPMTYWFAIYLANGAGHIPIHTVRRALYKHVFKVKIGNRSVIHWAVDSSSRRACKSATIPSSATRVFLDGRKGLHIGDNVSIASEARAVHERLQDHLPPA